MSSANKLLQAASGNAGEAVYVDDVFSTDVYTGTGSSLNIVNGIDNSGEGGLVWVKRRDGGTDHTLYDTVRGATKWLSSSLSNAEGTLQGVTAFNNNGYTLGTYASPSSEDWVGWNFRKQPGFFDVVTYTGDGTSSRDIAHSLGSKPGFIITKRTNSAGNWTCYHQALGYEERIYLDLTSPKSTNSATWVQEPTATHFTVGSENNNGDTYVAYLFAHNDQSFGDNSDESIIKCGSYTGGTDGTTFVDLGFEPQWLLLKRANSSSNWAMLDIMRGLSAAQGTPSHRIEANSSSAENTVGLNGAYVSSTGFYPWGNGGGDWNASGGTYIYIAIRRPMKTPEYGTDVFTPTTYSGNSSSQRLTSTGIADLAFLRRREGEDWVWSDRLGIRPGKKMRLNSVGDVESDPEGIKGFDHNDGIDIGDNSDANGSSYTFVAYMLTRATGFFDVVAYTGNATSDRDINHNLGVTPELMIVKSRDSDQNWVTYDADTGATRYMRLNTSGQPATTSGMWNNTAPTASVFTVDGTGGRAEVNASGTDYSAYLFASVAGVSKIGVYTGTGSNVNVDCGFSAGARFILIKRNSDSGEWYIWDSARGIVAGNDPYVLANSNSAEVTNTDYIDPLSTGFTVTSSAPVDLNTSGHTYIFLAIA